MRGDRSAAFLQMGHVIVSYRAQRKLSDERALRNEGRQGKWRAKQAPAGTDRLHYPTENQITASGGIWIAIVALAFANENGTAIR